MGYFGTHPPEFGEKRVDFDVQCITVKGRFIWAEKSVFYYKKGVYFGLKSQCFIAKRFLFELKSQRFAPKKGVIFKLENKDGYHFLQ